MHLNGNTLVVGGVGLAGVSNGLRTVFRKGVVVLVLCGTIALSSHLHPVGHDFFRGRRPLGGVRRRLRS